MINNYYYKPWGGKNMKGTIVKCLEELVFSQFGRNKWEKSLEDAGLKKTPCFLPSATSTTRRS